MAIAQWPTDRLARPAFMARSAWCQKRSRMGQLCMGTNEDEQWRRQVSHPEKRLPPLTQSRHFNRGLGARWLGVMAKSPFWTLFGYDQLLSTMGWLTRAAGAWLPDPIEYKYYDVHKYTMSAWGKDQLLYLMYNDDKCRNCCTVHQLKLPETIRITRQLRVV